MIFKFPKFLIVKQIPAEPRKVNDYADYMNSKKVIASYTINDKQPVICTYLGDNPLNHLEGGD